MVSADEISGEAEREKAVGVHDDGVNDRACLIRNKGEKQGKLGQKKGENER